MDYLHYNGDCCEKDKGEGNMYFKCGHRVLVENTGNYGYNFADYDVCTDNPNVKACCGNPTDCVTPDGKCVVDGTSYDVNPNIGSAIDGPNEQCSNGHWCPANFRWHVPPYTSEEYGYCIFIPPNCWFNPEKAALDQKCGLPSPISYIYELTNQWYTDMRDTTNKACFNIQGTNNACCLDVMLDKNNRNLDYYRTREIRIY